MSRTIPQSLTYASSAQLYAIAISDAIPTQTRQRLVLSDAQTVFLEHQFHDNSHPTLEERQRLAFQTDMEVNSITSWFQNKRKASSRRRAQNIATSKRNSNTSTTTTMTTRRKSKSKASSASSRRSSTSSASTSTSTSTSSSASRRPSLDRVASRSELRAPTPRTPSRRHNPHGPLWVNMASSPIGPPSSPLGPEFIDFLQGQQTRSLEWACARRRLAVRDDVDDLPGLMEDASGDTDVELDEAVTPPSSCDASWTGYGGSVEAYKGGEPDDETMKAALALCGLMRG
ncbi:homeodomain transcription factor [Mycena alexandri]|uniref:Homeodomain transcription factor n=1 Tax=Mycena alexandri TaxID=1745969 RepID=A0AAD6X679_9AGAR|nr:homeodomain transcription factor [Mycena alexandri]